MTAHSELVARLEGASEGSRELDGLVEVAVRGVLAARTGLDRKHWAKWVSYRGTVSDGATTYAADPVTTSLDAALALAERVLPPDPDFSPQTPSVGWKINLYRGMIPTDQRGGWFANVRRHATDGFEGASESPALALCLAILKATATQPDGEKM